jgi:hypothetical protein
VSLRLAPASEEHLLALLPRGETIRNFVYTGVLDRVAAHARVSLLSVRPNADIWALLQSRYSSVLELTELPERRIVWQLREVLDMAHGRWLWSQAARSRWKARDSEAVGAHERLKRRSKKIACYPFANRPGLNFLSKLERLSTDWLRTTDRAIRIIDDLKPTVVFNASHIHSALSLPWVQAAQALNIRTGTFLFSWDNLTSQGRLLPRYDFYLVWNEPIRADLLRIYPEIRPEQVFVTGTPQFDPHFHAENYWSREEFCAHVGADPSRSIVLYTTSMPRPAVGEQRIVEGIARMLREMPEFGPPQLLVRVYPKDRTGRFDEIKSRCPEVLFPPVPWEPNWLTPLPDDSAVLTNTLRHADVGINVASTVSLELCMFGKPVVNAAYDPPGVDIRPFDYPSFYLYDHYRPVADSGAVLIARSEDEMAAMIREALSNGSATRQKQDALLRTMFGDLLDGASSDRVADTLLAMTGTRSESAVLPAGHSPRRATASRPTRCA